MPTFILSTYLFVMTSLSLCSPAVFADEKIEENIFVSGFKEPLVWKYTGIGVGVITVWGSAYWDYFTRSPHNASEGWFQHDARYGGADKLGHVYSAYTVSHFISSLMIDSDQLRSHAPHAYGAMSSFLILGYMEYGDSFSEFGFSHEDLMANLFGCVLGYIHSNYDWVANRFDFRWEYGLKPTDKDILTDYDNFKYSLVARLDGFDFTKVTWAKYLDLQLGYYTRGYMKHEDRDERYVYYGLGLNLSHLFEQASFTRTSRVLRYVQVPSTYLSYGD